ncbi:MAG: hypothetical protein AVDCRST_MAG50-2086 [uncultured Acidimicrobiales bacterium]|uniref:Uncharacterized protein n=1 Tax=uncultured Acidimicrobiales bacterium TaxID=310071 RepID=A0A6J4IC46_9ACTN|nr:MAG: hypothetical protein AVDCRST_MAG50-2086 [uncultured Acidimicrobiales bacterium]
MSPWLVVFLLPAALAVPALILVLSSVVEHRFLSPQSMIVSAARSRRAAPEYAEVMVAREFDRILSGDD